jgi:hypothetical protein
MSCGDVMFKIWKLALAAMIVLGVAAGGKNAAAADVNFRWAILAASTEGMRALDFKGSPIVFSGTALQLYIEHLNNCHVYLYLLDSSNQLTPIYPPQKGYYDYGFPRGPKLVPPGDQSFTFVPPPGAETLLLVASVDRLFQLEELTDIFNNDPSQLGQQKLLIDRVEQLLEGREKSSRAAEDIEKVTIKYRGAGGIVARTFEAVEVDTRAIYGRRLVIDHR